METMEDLDAAMSAAYDGPNEFKLFARFLPYLGELFVSFSYLERRVTWAIGCLLNSTMHEADELEDYVKNFSSRIKFLWLASTPVARQTKTEADFLELFNRLEGANTFRNRIIHNSFTGGSKDVSQRPFIFSVNKKRFNKDPDKGTYQISIPEMRENARANAKSANDLRLWINANVLEARRSASTSP